MSTIYELTNAYQVLSNMLDEAETDEQARQCFDTINDQLEDKADAYAALIANINADIEGVKGEERRLKQRRQSYENKVKRLKENLFESMQATGKRKFKTQRFSFSIAKNGGAQPMHIKVAETDLPDEYVIWHVEPDKEKLRQAVLNGDERYAELLPRGESLRIK